MVLNVQEIENLFPLEYIDNHKFEGVGIINKQHFDTLLNNCHTEYILQYLDLKKGVKKSDVVNDTHYQTFMSYCFIHNSLINKGIEFQDFLSSISDDDYIQRPLQESLLKNVLNDIKEREKNKEELHPYLFQFQEIEWKRIGQFLLDWGCARSKEALV